MPAEKISVPTAPAVASSADMVVSVPWDRVEGFVGQLTHDVRNGLNALELQLTYLGEISTDPEAVAEVKRLRGSLANVTRQLQVVKTMMSAVSLHVLAYPAVDLFEDLRERLERSCPAPAQAVSWNISLAADIVLMVDPDLSINGLLELFANAFQMGASSLECTAVSHPSHVSFILRETPGAAPAISPDLWGREPLLTSRRGAYGMGLFRLRRILETQGGALNIIYSQTENRLTTTASLPRAVVGRD